MNLNAATDSQFKIDRAKTAASVAAAGLILADYEKNFKDTDKIQIIGAGTGSTVNPGLHALCKSLKQSGITNVAFMSTSAKSEEIVKSYGLTTIPIPTGPDHNNKVRITFDGADFISDEILRSVGIAHIVKGGGAAQGDEKDVALISEISIIVADHTKRCPRLDAACWIPIEVAEEKKADLIHKLTSTADGFSENARALKVVDRTATPNETGRKARSDGRNNPIIEAHFSLVDDQTLARLDSISGIKHGLFFGTTNVILEGDALGGVRRIDCLRTQKPS